MLHELDVHQACAPPTPTALPTAGSQSAAFGNNVAVPPSPSTARRQRQESFDHSHAGLIRLIVETSDQEEYALPSLLQGMEATEVRVQRLS